MRKAGEWNRAGVAFADVSTGEFSATQFSGENVGMRVFEELSRVEPREVIIPESWAERGVTTPDGIHLSAAQDWTFEYEGAEELLCDHFGVATLAGFGLQDQHDAVAAAGGVLQYLRATQKQSLEQLSTIRARTRLRASWSLDQFTRRNLELSSTIRQGKTERQFARHTRSHG